MANKNSSTSGIGIHVNTDTVRNTVTILTTLNGDMDNSFSSVASAISNLDNNWDGTAASKAIPEFNKIKSNFMGSSGRKAVMKQYIDFLSKIVADDYDATETTNTSLSNLFK